MVRTFFRYLGIAIATILLATGVGMFAEGVWNSPPSQGHLLAGFMLSAIGGLWLYRAFFGLSPKDGFYEQYRHPNVYAPGEEATPTSSKEPFFLPGGLVILTALLALFAFKVWWKAEGYGAAINHWLKALIF